MRFVSLFAGVGGIDLGLERAGMTCVGQVELDDFATKVLEKHWPTVPRIRDVRDFHGTEFGPFDLLAGGYPCQPFSVAGKRGGETDERHLWPEMLRIIRNVRPSLILVENVPGHLSLGFGRVLGDLAESGYDAEWDCIPAAAVGAPHRRDRLFFVAYPSRGGRHDASASATRAHPTSRGGAWTVRGCGRIGPSALADPSSERGNGGAHHGDSRPRPIRQPRDRGLAPRSRRPWEVSEPPVRGGIDGLPNRVDRLRALGNAVVPQVAQYVGERIMEAAACR